jgi:hypothetical protein
LRCVVLVDNMLLIFYVCGMEVDGFEKSDVDLL